MAMLKIIAVYVLAIVVVAVLGNIGLLLFLPFKKYLTKAKSLMLAVFPLVAACSNIFAVYIFVWLCHKLGVQATLTMFIIPYLLTVSTDFKRIKRAESGRRMMGISLVETGEPHYGSEKFQSFLVRNEYGYLIGDILGLSLGVVLFL